MYHQMQMPLNEANRFSAAPFCVGRSDFWSEMRKTLQSLFLRKEVSNFAVCFAKAGWHGCEGG